MQTRNIARHFHLGNCIIVCSTVLELGDYTRSSELFMGLINYKIIRGRKTFEIEINVPYIPAV